MHWLAAELEKSTGSHKSRAIKEPKLPLLFHQQRLDPTMSEPLLRQSDAEEDELTYDYRSSQISKEVICLCTNLHSCLVDSEFYM